MTKQPVEQGQSNPTNDENPPSQAKYCGMVMPISHIDGYEAGHWGRVQSIIERAIKKASYRPRMVSESEETAVIQANIVQNLYFDEIVVVDVSGKNPNVMFELGLRLAFDKPAVIIKDDRTTYSFDTGPVKHIAYRADLRYDDVEMLEEKIMKAIRSSVEAKNSNPNYSPFLGNFAKMTVAKVETHEITADEFVVESLKTLQKQVADISRGMAINKAISPPIKASDIAKFSLVNTSKVAEQAVRDAMVKNLLSSLLIQSGKPKVIDDAVKQQIIQASISEMKARNMAVDEFALFVSLENLIEDFNKATVKASP